MAEEPEDKSTAEFRKEAGRHKPELGNYERREKEEFGISSRAFKALNACNNIIIRSESEKELIDNACEILIFTGGYCLAWIGFIHEGNKNIYPAASAGRKKAYLKDLLVSWDRSEKIGTGPAGTAVRTGEPSVVRDVASDPNFRPWKDAALECGIRSCITLPVQTGEKPLGVIGIYAEETEAFGDEEVKLLQTLVDNLAHGIKSLRTRQELEETKKECEEVKEHFQNLFEASPLAITVFGPKGEICDQNTAAERTFGWKKEEVIGRFPPTMSGETSKKHFESNLNKALAGNTTNGEIVRKRKDGSYIDLIFYNAPIYDKYGKVTGVLSICEDTTELNRTLRALKESERKYRTLFENSLDGIYRSTQEGKLIDANCAYVKMFGYNSRDEMLGINVIETLYVDKRDREKLHNKGRPYVLQLRKKDGSVFWAEASSWKVYDSEKDEIYYEGTVRDITERKKNEEALKASEERFSKAFNSSPSMMSIVRYKDRKVIDANDSYVNILGYPREKLIGKCKDELNIWVDKEKREKLWETIAAYGAARNVETRKKTKYGDIIDTLVSCEMIEVNGQKCVLFVSQDITEYKRLKEELERLDRLNMVGEMAAGISHEIRNPMSVVRGYLQLVKTQKDPDILSKYIDIMINELDRANGIITEFLSLAKTKSVNLEFNDLNEIIESLYSLISADAYVTDKEVLLELNPLPPLLLDENEIRQLILNLARNGIEAMSNGGTLTIRTFTEGTNAVVLTVSDEGPGIDPEILKNLWKPFQTTKDEGTGLGLSVCYSIAERHNASIDVVTGKEGTTFSVKFPQRRE